MHPVRSFFAAVALALLIPSVALAAGENARKDKGHFPMPGDAFTARVEARLTKVSQKLEERLEKSRIGDNLKKEIRADFERSAAKIRAAANKAAADGSVTKEEAKRVRELSRDLRKDMKAKRGPGKPKKAK